MSSNNVFHNSLLSNSAAIAVSVPFPGPEHAARGALRRAHCRQAGRQAGRRGRRGAAMAESEGEGAPITTSAVLMSASKHIGSKCGAQNRAFLDCKRGDANPEKCLQQGQDVSRCVISQLRELNSKCPKAMESYTKCMDYYSNEFELCRKEQREFEASCPL